MEILCKASAVAWEGRSCHNHLEGIYVNLLSLLRIKSTALKVQQAPPVPYMGCRALSLRAAPLVAVFALIQSSPNHISSQGHAGEPAPPTSVLMAIYSLPITGPMSRGHRQHYVTARFPTELTQSPPTISKRLELQGKKHGVFFLCF